jgi:hypothetical protein
MKQGAADEADGEVQNAQAPFVPFNSLCHIATLNFNDNVAALEMIGFIKIYECSLLHLMASSQSTRDTHCQRGHIIRLQCSFEPFMAPLLPLLTKSTPRHISYLNCTSGCDAHVMRPLYSHLTAKKWPSGPPHLPILPKNKRALERGSTA